MTITTLFCHEVRVLRGTSTTDRYENTVLSWTSPRRRTSKARVVQRSRTEQLDGRDARVTDWICYLPAGTDVTALDRIQWGDYTFEVVGVPNRAFDRHQEHHVELDLELVEG